MSKSLKTDGLGAFLELQSAFRVAGAEISTGCKNTMPVFEAPDAESVEGLISCHGSVTLQ